MRRILRTRAVDRGRLIALLAAALGGCAPRSGGGVGGGASATRAEAPIVVEKAVVDRGFVRGVDRIEQDYLLKVWGKGPVTILKAVPSCTCSSFSPDLTNIPLPPNSVHLVKMIMRIPWQPGAKMAEVEMMTAPPGPRPLSLVLRVLTGDKPLVSPTPLKIQVAGDLVPRAELKVTYLRKPSDPPLTLDEARSALKPLFVKSRRLESVEKATGGGQDEKVTTDVLTLEVATRDTFAIGTHPAELRLAWEGALPESVLPVTIEVLHPLAPMSPRIFFGELAPGQNVKKEVRLIRRRPGVKLKDITSRSPRVKAVSLPDGDRLTLNIAAPEQPGRFDTAVVLSYASPEVPDSVLTLTGIVAPAVLPTASVSAQ